MFASLVTSQVVFEDGAVNIRKLSARSLEKAQEARQIKAASLSKGLGAELIKAFSDGTADKVAESVASKPVDLEAMRKARYTGYDPEQVITAGVVSWTYSLKLSEGIPDLDEEASKKIFEAILDLSLPPIDPEEAKAASGKS